VSTPEPPSVVEAELLCGGVGVVIVRAAVSEPDQVAELVHQGEIGIAALGLERAVERSGVVAEAPLAWPRPARAPTQPRPPVADDDYSHCL
jgi:hypothetical protein